MERITLYEFVREDGNISVSPNKPDGEYQTSYRLIADEGMILTDADGNTAKVIDTDAPNQYQWREIEAPEEEPQEEPQEEPKTVPTTAEILNALLGVTE